MTALQVLQRDVEDVETQTGGIMYPESIEKALEELDEMLAKILGSVAAAEIAEQFLEAFPLNGGNVRWCDGVTVDFTAKTMADVAEALAWFAKHGQRQSFPPFDHPGTNSRCYNLAGIKLWADFAPVSDDGATCRYVQTGTKEVPVMELQCGG